MQTIFIDVIFCIFSGNSVGVAKNGTRCLGCGLQETFVNCADISIGGTVDRVHVSKDMFPPHTGVEEVVLPQVPDLTSIIDRASPHSFTDVLSAIGQNPQKAGSPEGRQDTPTIMVVTRRRNQGDLPGLTRDQVDSTRWNFHPLHNLNPNRLHIDTSRDSRSKGRFVGMDIFGHRAIPDRTMNRGAALSSKNMLSMPAAMSRDEILRLRAKNARVLAGTSPQASTLSKSRGSGLDVPPPSLVSGIFLPSNTRGPNVQWVRPSPNRRGGSGLMGSVSDTVANIPQNTHGVTRIPAPRKPLTHSNTRPPVVTVIASRDFNNGRNMVLGKRQPTSRPNMNKHQIQNPQFLSRMAELRRAYPNKSDWSRGDGMTSHRSAVRHSPLLDTHNYSTAEIRQRVPDLPRNIGPRQDISSVMERREQPNTVQSRENWFPNTQTNVRERRLRLHDQTMSKTEPRDRSSNLPRRIVVPSMAIAQHLLRKYPQLRGRVFLSREAHLRNKYNNVVSRYSRRQRWQS